MDIAIVGGGISGLSLALRLKQKGNDVVLFEACSNSGGKIATMYKDGFELDLGPVTCAETPALRDLIENIGLGHDIVSASSASSIRYIYSRKKLHRVEPGPLKMMTGSLLPVKGKLAFWKFPFAGPKTEDESAAAFARRRFGEEAYQKIFNPMLNGIYAGDAEKLSARSTLNLSNRKSRRIISLNGGLGKLTNTMRSHLNGAVMTNTPVSSITKTSGGVKVSFQSGSELFDQVHFTTPSFVTADLLRNVDHSLHDTLKQIRYSDVTQVYCEVVPGEVNFDGFGFLVPTEERLSLLGGVCVSNVFPQKTPDNRMMFVLFVGGDRPYPFTASKELALDEFNRILKPALTRVLHVQEWKRAIPQFYVGHEKIVERIKEFEKYTPEISIKGNFVTGVALGECV